jgi:hypothetical protein
MNAVTERDRWETIKAELMADSEKMCFVNSISKCEAVVVQRRYGAVSSQVGRCHLNVREQVEQLGGKQVYGWQIATEQTEGAQLRGCVYAIFHSCWRDDAGVIWDITDEQQKTRVFLLDPVRSYDFYNAVGYNNRVVFLSDYVSKNPKEQVVRNKTFYTAKGFKSRDPAFEKYKHPKSIGEVISAVPSKYRMNGDEISYEGQLWLSLKYSVSFRS